MPSSVHPPAHVNSDAVVLHHFLLDHLEALALELPHHLIVDETLGQLLGELLRRLLELGSGESLAARADPALAAGIPLHGELHAAFGQDNLLVGRKAGLSLDTMVSILRSSSAASWLLENHHRIKALAGDFVPGFALDLMFKDLRLFVETAVDSKAPALIASAALQLYNAARVAGHGQQDQGVVVRELERLVGVELGKLTPAP